MRTLLLTAMFAARAFAGCTNQGDKIEDLAQAIAKAEGFNKKGSIPNRYRNPGDLKAIKGWVYPGQIGVGKANHVIFKNYGAGWEALRHQLQAPRAHNRQAEAQQA